MKKFRHYIKPDSDMTREFRQKLSVILLIFGQFTMTLSAVFRPPVAARRIPFTPLGSVFNPRGYNVPPHSRQRVSYILNSFLFLTVLLHVVQLEGPDP